MDAHMWQIPCLSAARYMLDDWQAPTRDLSCMSHRVLAGSLANSSCLCTPAMSLRREIQPFLRGTAFAWGMDRHKAVREGLWCCPTPLSVAALATAAAETHSQGRTRTLLTLGVQEPPSPEENEPLQTSKDGPAPRQIMALSMRLAVRPGIWDAAAADIHHASMEPAGHHQQVHGSSSLESLFMPRLMPKLLILGPSPNLPCFQKTLPRLSTTPSTRFISGNSSTTWTTPSAAAPAQSGSGGNSGSS